MLSPHTADKNPFMFFFILTGSFITSAEINIDIPRTLWKRLNNAVFYTVKSEQQVVYIFSLYIHHPLLKNYSWHVEKCYASIKSVRYFKVDFNFFPSK